MANFVHFQQVLDYGTVLISLIAVISLLLMILSIRCCSNASQSTSTDVMSNCNQSDDHSSEEVLVSDEEKQSMDLWTQMVEDKDFEFWKDFKIYALHHDEIVVINDEGQRWALGHCVANGAGCEIWRYRISTNIWSKLTITTNQLQEDDSVLAERLPISLRQNSILLVSVLHSSVNKVRTVNVWKMQNRSGSMLQQRPLFRVLEWLESQREYTISFEELNHEDDWSVVGHVINRKERNSVLVIGLKNSFDFGSWIVDQTRSKPFGMVCEYDLDTKTWTDCEWLRLEGLSRMDAVTMTEDGRYAICIKTKYDISDEDGIFVFDLVKRKRIECKLECPMPLRFQMKCHILVTRDHFKDELLIGGFFRTCAFFQDGQNHDVIQSMTLWYRCETVHLFVTQFVDELPVDSYRNPYWSTNHWTVSVDDILKHCVFV